MSCPDCFSGHQHDGEPRGTMIQLNGLSTYVSEPTNGRPVKGIIVIVPDAFGVEFINNKLLADSYASKGDYKVYLPDFMQGHSLPVWMIDTTRKIMAPGNYLSKPYHVFWALYAGLVWHFRNRPVKSFPLVKGWFEQLRKDEAADLPVGAAGFCWGGKHTVLLANPEHKINGKPLIDAGFTGHPSFLVIPSDIENVGLPVSFAIGENDALLNAKSREALKTIVESKPEGQKGELRVYPKCGHGFCVRADAKELDVNQQALEAEDQCIEWFNRSFKFTS